MAFPGTPVQELFPIRRPTNGPPGLRARQKKRSRSEKAILGATLGIPGHSWSNSWNGSHDLIYVKTLFSEQLSERLSDWEPVDHLQGSLGPPGPNPHKV